MPPVTAMAARSPRQPRYLQLADQLRGDIAAGVFPDGFPTENALCTRFGVSRFTVREALRALQGEGLIERKRGSGTIVQPAAARGGALHQPLSNVDELLQYARDTQVDFQRQGDGGLPPWIEEQVGWRDLARWARFWGVRRDAAGTPIATVIAYVHQMLDPYIESLRPNGGAIFRQIEALAGLRVARVAQDIKACAADAETAQHLSIEEGSPVLRIIRTYFDSDERAFEISVSYHPGDRFAYSMHIEVEH